MLKIILAAAASALLLAACGGGSTPTPTSGIVETPPGAVQQGEGASKSAISGGQLEPTQPVQEGGSDGQSSNCRR